MSATIESLGLGYRVDRPLAEAGYTLVDEIKDMPPQELAQHVRGELMLGRLMRALNRSEEFERYIGHYSVEVKDEQGNVVGSVPAGELRKIASLGGTANRFGYPSVEELRTAIEMGKVTWEELARYRWEREQARKAALEPAEPTRETPSTVEDLRAVEREVEAIVGQYQSDYDVRKWTRGDYQDIYRLARLEVYVDSAQRALLRQSPEDRVRLAGQAKVLTDQISAGLAEIRKLKDMLSVSLAARAERDKTARADEVVTGLMADAKQLVAERMTVLIHCGVRQAMFYPVFPKHVITATLKVKCAVCGEVLDWTLVSRTMLDNYVEAQDFKPKGAPPGIFDEDRRAQP